MQAFFCVFVKKYLKFGIKRYRVIKFISKNQ